MFLNYNILSHWNNKTQDVKRKKKVVPLFLSIKIRILKYIYFRTV